MKETLVDMSNVVAMSFDGPLYFWYVSLALAVGLVVALGNLFQRRSSLSRASIVLCCLAPLCVVAFSAMAVIFRADAKSETAVEDVVAPGIALAAMGIAALVAAVACVIMARHQRAMATAIALSGGWFVFWVYFVAAMSVSGVWL